MTRTPRPSSPGNSNFSSVLRACSRATPPPGTMPSARAARVACRASSKSALRSFISVSVAADLDLRHAAGQLRQPLLQLLAVVLALGCGDLALDQLGAALDGLL